MVIRQGTESRWRPGWVATASTLLGLLAFLALDRAVRAKVLVPTGLRRLHGWRLMKRKTNSACRETMVPAARRELATTVAMAGTRSPGPHAQAERRSAQTGLRWTASRPSPGRPTDGILVAT